MGSFRLTAGSLHLDRQFNFAESMLEPSALLALETRVQSQNKIKKSHLAISLTQNAVLLSPSLHQVLHHRDPHSPHSQAEPSSDGVAELRWRRRSKSPAAIQHIIAAIQGDLHLPGTSTPRKPALQAHACSGCHASTAGDLMHCASLRRWSDVERRE